MRERIATIVLVVIAVIASIVLSFASNSVYPFSVAGITAVAFYSLGSQNGFSRGVKRGAELQMKLIKTADAKRVQSESDRNYEQYLDWRGLK